MTPKKQTKNCPKAVFSLSFTKGGVLARQSLGIGGG